MTALRIVSGAVIAAGEGSRLKDFGVPKPLVEIAGTPLIAHVLENFEAAVEMLRESQAALDRAVALVDFGPASISSSAIRSAVRPRW